jgi:hypothetical protein
MLKIISIGLFALGLVWGHWVNQETRQAYPSHRPFLLYATGNCTNLAAAKNGTGATPPPICHYKAGYNCGHAQCEEKDIWCSICI